MSVPRVATSLVTMTALVAVACSGGPAVAPGGGHDSDPGSSTSTGVSDTGTGTATEQGGSSLTAGEAGIAVEAGGTESETAVGTGVGTGSMTGQGTGSSTASVGTDPATSGATGAGTSSSTGGGTGGDASAEAEAGAAAALPVLLSLTANQSGRTGADLVLTVRGTDKSATSFGVDVRLLDKSGNPVLAFEDWSGNLAYAERVVLFDGQSAAGSTSFSRTVTLAGMMRGFPSIASVTGALVDTAGMSNKIPSPVVAQPVKTLSQACDPTTVTNRCGFGLSCAGSPAKCSAASAPQITKFAWVSGAAGPNMLFLGTDPADDISSLHIEFLDGTGKPVMVDLSGGGDYQSSVDLMVPAEDTTEGVFFEDVSAAVGFDKTVPALAVTPVGSATGSGTRVKATIEPPQVVGAGAACDLRGFATCVAGDTCISGTFDGGVAAATCVPTASAQDQAAAAAPVLDPTTTSVFATGYAMGPHIWGDAPTGCAAAGVVGLPEAIVQVHLPADVPSLTVTTNNPETTQQVVVFVLTGTGEYVGDAALGCNDGTPAILTLPNLPAGDYTVVIESTLAAGSTFGLSIY